MPRGGLKYIRCQVEDVNEHIEALFYVTQYTDGGFAETLYRLKTEPSRTFSSLWEAEQACK